MCQHKNNQKNPKAYLTMVANSNSQCLGFRVGLVALLFFCLLIIFRCSTGEVNMASILAVDDSASMRQMVSFTLKGAGYDVVEAVDGVDALNKAKQQSVNLVITDVNMPNMDGITLIAELRKLPNYKFTPLLMLTTESAPEKKQAGKAAGATGWIVKPFNPDQLVATIKKVIG